MRRLGFVVFLLLIVAAYFGGYLPEHKRRVAAESDLRLMNAKMADAEARLGICGLENQLLSILKKVDENNYGDGQKLSTEFFDATRNQMTGTQNANFKDAFQSVLNSRDSVTADLSRNDRAAGDLLRQDLERLHNVLQSVK